MGIKPLTGTGRYAEADSDRRLGSDRGQLESGTTTVPPHSGFRPTEKASGIVPKLWADDEETEHTDVSRLTELVSLARRSPAVRPRLTIMTGARAGKVIALDTQTEFSLGRTKESDIRVNDTGVSRLHCRLTRSGDAYVIHDLDSTNGTLVNGNRITSATLRSGDRIQIGDTFVMQFALLDDAEDLLAQQLYEMSTRDPLTKAFNRRYFSERLDAELAHAGRHQAPLGVMVLDLDKFKSVNDTFGHGGGDALLRAIVQEIQQIIRSEDLLARYGGEEFVLLVRSATREGTAMLAERIRARIAALRVSYEGRSIAASVSIGIAEAAECAYGSQTQLLALADRRLYQAKALGRNRVESVG